MNIKVYRYYTSSELATPNTIYGNVPFVMNTEKATCTIFLNEKEIKIKYWSWEFKYKDLYLYEYATRDEALQKEVEKLRER